MITIIDVIISDIITVDEALSILFQFRFIFA